MKNPYQNLVIYYFEGIIELDTAVTADPRFLGNWQESDTSFVFFCAPVPFFAKQMAVRHPDARLVDVYEMTVDQWHGERIVSYGVAGFYVRPPWEKGSGDPDRHHIILDPGVVFGTGRHQTTHDCLELVHQVCAAEKIQTVLDIGTGTGLLALGAAAMGCRRVLACDFNLLAVQTARKNIVRNRCEKRVLAFQARGETMMDLACDLVVANIHYDIMQHLIAHPALMAKKYLILSGLLSSQARKVKKDLENRQVRILDHRCPDGIWNTFLAMPFGG
ncbi:MAG: 50S ribosomal protein L11 methyltransferase [Desulfotignum sp.]|jgi:ribosomal protein L11 methyltransferase|nr:50S ribosomal protein L11 methyltransferase [Desulfotignum sp.]